METLQTEAPVAELRFGPYQDNAMEWPDILIIVLYFCLVLGVGIGAACRASTDNASGYFLAGRSMKWFMIGSSTFATNIGAPMFIGLAGSAASVGIGVVMFEWHAMFMIVALGWIFLPVYLASGVYTMPQYLQMRYGGQRIRVWHSVVTTILIIISQVAGQMYAGALFITQLFHWELYSSIILILAITAVYTILGGLTAVMWTNTIETVILIAGAFTTAMMSLVEVGGFKGIRANYLGAASKSAYLQQALYQNMSCGFPPDDSFHIFRAPDDPNYPWPGMIFGLTILATDAWCVNQMCVQRSLAAKSLTHAKGGLLLAAYLKVLPFVFFIIPGLVSRILFPDEIGCSDPDVCKEICGNEYGCTNIAYPMLVQRILPVGVRGLMMAALLSALMSSMTSIFNSSSTIFTMDLWRRCRPRAKEMELMIVGRMWTVVLAGIALAWLPVLTNIQGATFWDYTQSIGAFIVPPIVIVFLFGLFWKRATEVAAFCSLVIGLAIGVCRMVLEWYKSGPPCGSGEVDDRLTVVTKVHYLHFAIILGGCCAIVMVVVSALTKPRTPGQLHRVTYWTKDDKEFPDLTDDEDDFFNEAEYLKMEKKRQEKEEKRHEKQGNCYNSNVFLEKWCCGVDRSKPVVKKPTKESRIEFMKLLTNITEEPRDAAIMAGQAVLCAALCVFLHAFWY